MPQPTATPKQQPSKAGAKARASQKAERQAVVEKRAPAASDTRPRYRRARRVAWSTLFVSAMMALLLAGVGMVRATGTSREERRASVSTLQAWAYEDIKEARPQPLMPPRPLPPGTSWRAVNPDGTPVAQRSTCCPLALQMDALSPLGEADPIPGDQCNRKTEHGWSLGDNPLMSGQAQLDFEAMLVEEKKTFAYAMTDLPGYCGEFGEFELALDEGVESVFEAKRRQSPMEDAMVREKMMPLAEVGIIRPVAKGVRHRFAANSVVARKKDAETGAWTDKRIAQDMRRLNKVTPQHYFCLPRVDEIFQQLGRPVIFSKIDLRAGFMQLGIKAEDQEKTAFWLGSELYCFTRLNFGLRNGPMRFQEIISKEIEAAGLTAHCRVYLDDLLCFDDAEDGAAGHLEHVRAVLQMLHRCGLRMEVHPRPGWIPAVPA